MKKILSSLFVLMFAIALTGCGNEKKLTCESELTRNGLPMDYKVTGVWVEDKAIRNTVTMEIDATDYSEYGDIDTLYEGFKTAYEPYNKYDGFKITVTKKGNLIKIVLEMEYDKVDEELYQAFDLGSGNIDATLEEVKKMYEDQGYTCK